MQVKDIVYEDFINYRKPSMFIIFPHCNFKCDREYGTCICQNGDLVKQPTIDVDIKKVINKYKNNYITEAIVCAGLEPFDSFDELFEFIKQLREHTLDDVVIYTGYNKDEIHILLSKLKIFKNIIVKFGRYVPNQKSHYDDVLGVYLASDNQYAERIS